MSSTSLNLMIWESFILISDKNYTFLYMYIASCTLLNVCNEPLGSVKGRNFLTD